MLQHFAWLGCAYFLVKACEIAANKANRNEDGKLSAPALGAIWMAGASVGVFALLYSAQAASISPSLSRPLESTALESPDVCLQAVENMLESG
ncbi:hypothetical protein [Erythrobacter sp. QSSC1-22B]|uniref:hypothetical protein n=1 Tax=Erythrobacter sp. QSSC1-22B TaxID=1860125 RepID=UPI00119E0BDA|nr:hypothetical protein [Erythrobacter sp. QSSC1-22B]